MKKLFITFLAMVSAVGNVFSQSKTITGGNDHGLIICAQGYLYTWGNNYSKTVGGPLLGIDPTDPKTGGNATKDYVTEPSRVKSGNLTFSQVTAGSGAFNLALACNSVVYAWGENTNGGCGQGDNGGNVIEYPVPVLKGETSGYDESGKEGGDYLGGVTYIAASTNSGFAIMDDGRVVGWGGGTWNGSTNKTTPVYIKDKDGNDITNVTHISGGDDNCLIRTADGKLYGIGPWNGSKQAAVTYATPVLKEEDKEELTDIRMSAAGDVCGFAVTGDGFVWSWGNGGWGGSTGVAQTGANHPMARKVSSGEYKSISGEEYLTDVKEVIGGRGHGAAVTKEGYLVYWGCDEGNGGIAPVDAATAKTWASGGQGVKPVLARYCDASGKPGDVVKNAVSISRGDNFDFMMNDEDKYFVWGLNDLGQCGVGTTVSEYNCLVELKTIPCDIQDNCPEVFMTNQVKCPGEEIELDCGFVVPKGKEERYFIEWSYNGKVLNSSTKNSTKEERAKDEFNVQSIYITDPGKYSVIVEYIGNNIPCDKCKPAETEITVEDMPMPIDTVITEMNCVMEDFELRPTSNDEICFEAIVNDKFYSSKDKVTFAAFSTTTSKDTLGVFETTGAGGEIKFCVSGDKIIDIQNNKDEESKDTIYNIWLEDISKFETMLRKGEPAASATGGSFQSYGMLLDMRASADLISFDIYAKSYSGATDISVTPVVYMAEKNQNDLYVVGDVFWTGKAQTFSVDASGPNKCTVKCDVRIPGSTARGIRYILGMKFTGNCTLYEEGVTVKQNSAEFPTPIIDTEEFGIYEMGATANSYTSMSNGSDKTCYYNVVFGKLTDYDCGRIMLSARYGCPPCNDPKNLEITASETIKDDVDAKYKKVVELCKESDELVLDIEPLVGKNDPTAKFDIFWSDQNSINETNALAKDVTGGVTTLEFKTDWATVAGATDIEKDVEKVYYVMVYDHDKPKNCTHYDSIKVIAHPAPTDTLDWIEFCEGELTEEPTFEITGKTINWVDEPKDIAALTGTTATGTKEYTYKYTVIDDETGCKGVEHTLTISVNKTGKPDVQTTVPLLKNPTNKFKLSAAVNSIDTDCEIRWYESETATSEMTNTSIALDEAKTIEVWAEQYNTKTGCTSERVKVELVINDAPVPEVTNESLCIDNEIPDLSEYVKAKDTDHVLNWYDDPSAEKGTGSSTAPSFKATAAGTYKFYVSQTNTLTSAESEKATLTITVHEVATLDLSANKTEYCINETAEELTFSANNDGDFTTAKWSKKSDMSDAAATLTPKTDEKGTVTYYAQAEYSNVDAQKSYASTVCYGKIQDIDITTNKTEVPSSETNYTVQYLKAEGDKNSSYKSLLDQDGTAVKVEAGHTLKWYDANKNSLASEPTPEYIANETGERKVTYYVSQVNTTTNCESELKEVTAIISSFPAPEVTSITLCQESEKLDSPYPLTATISTKGGFAASDYELIWYKKDPKADPSAEEFKTIDLSLENLSYDATTETEKDFKYWVVQRYTGPGGGQSPAAELLVTLYSKPILKTTKPKPICLGGEVDLKDLYTISNRISNQKYELEYLNSSGTNIDGSIATMHGLYESRAWFELSSGEICRSKFEQVFVTVNELEVAIEGDNTTCPGIGVDLKAVLKTKNMDENDTPSYSWNISPTGITGQMETLNTSGEGLVKKGDKITVNLEVSMGACKGKKPVDAHIITVDDPGVDGTIKFDEMYNANSGIGTYTLSKNGIVEFDGCNSKVDVLFNVKQTGDEFTYENLETGVKKTGKFSNGEGHFDIKAGMYEVSYINTCATSFKFDVKDKSLDISGSPSTWSVCEGTPLTIKIVNNDNTPFVYDPRKYKVEWQKDGETLPGYDTEVLNIPSTTPADNGVYSYTVTSSGCVYHDKIAMGGSFTSKPKVKIDESLLENKGVYEAVRTTSKDITIPIVQSIGIDMTTLSDKIIWKEEGVEVNRGETLSLASVDGDHEYNIIIANGEKGYDTEYCGTSLDITLKADALLSIEAILIGEDGKQKTDMCLNEEGVGFQIDTTGTGKILHPDKFTFKIVETIDGVKKEVKWAKKNEYLFASISPDKSATYEITYKYSVGNQDKSLTSEITVHPAYVVEWDRNVRLCEGETGFIQITKAEPASELTLTWEPDECLRSGSRTGANVEAVFSGYGLTTQKALTLVVSNGGICSDKKYYPEFTIDKAIEGNIIAPEYICEGHIATLDASTFKATEYVWSSVDQLGEGVTMTGPSINVVSKPGYASYTVEMQRGACTESAETTIEVRYAPRFDRIDSLSFRSVEIVLQSNTGTAPFQYIVDENYDENINEPIKDSLDYGNHSIKIIDAAGCVIDSSFVTNAPGLEIPIHISPNGDGSNDAFSIPTLREAYPDANIRIYDRWGKKLADYKAGNAEMDWDGSYNGVQMPSTDYWYEIEIKEIKKTYTGHFTLIRQ